MGLGVKRGTASSQALEMKVTRQSWILDSRYWIPDLCEWNLESE